MSATEDTAAQQAADPSTPPEALAWIAANRPDLHMALASNPSTYPDLLTWLQQHGSSQVREALMSRGEPQVSAAPVQDNRESTQAWYRQGTGEAGERRAFHLPRWARNVLVGVAGAAVLGVGGWLLVTQVFFPRGAASPQGAVTDLAGALAEGDGVRTWLLMAPDEVDGLEGALKDAADRAESLDLVGGGEQFAFSGLTTSVATVSEDRAQVTVTGGTLTVTPAEGQAGARARALIDRASEGEAGAGDAAQSRTFDLAEVGESLEGGLQVTVVKEGRRWYVSPLLTTSTLVSRSLGSTSRTLSVEDLQRSSSTPQEAITNTVEAIARQDVPGVAGALSDAEGVPMLEMASAIASEFSSSAETVDVRLEGESVDRAGDRAVVTVEGLSATESDGTVSTLTYAAGCVVSDGEEDCALEQYRPLFPEDLQIVTVRGDDGMWGVSALGTLGLAAQEALRASDADLLRAAELQETLEPSATLDHVGTETVRRGDQDYVTVDVAKGEGPLSVGVGVDADQEQYVSVYASVDGILTPAESSIQYTETGFILLSAEEGEYRVLVQAYGDAPLPDEFTLAGSVPEQGQMASGEKLTTELAAGSSFAYSVAAGWLTGTVTSSRGYATAGLWSNDGLVWLGSFADESTAVLVPAEGAKLYFAPGKAPTSVDLTLGPEPPFGFELTSGELSTTVTVTPNYSSRYTLTGPAGLSYDITATPSDDSSFSLVVDGSYNAQTNSDGSQVFVGAYDSSGSISVQVYGGSWFSTPGEITLTATVSAPPGD